MRSTLAHLSGMVTLFVAVGVGRAQDPSLLLYLPCDEGAGNTAYDLSGNKHHAQLKGAATWTEGNSNLGKAIQFGKDAYAEIPPDDAFHLTTRMTLMCWTRVDGDFGDQQMAIEKGAAWGPGEYSLLPDFEDNVLFQAFDLPEACNDELRGGDIRDGKWHHIAGTFDGETLKVYVDGTETQKLSCPGKLRTNDEPIYIASRGGTVRWTDGAYDEIRIYSRALGASEIKGAMLPGMAVTPGNRAAVLWATLRSPFASKAGDDDG